ncbi:interleukin-6 [Dromiciops gliroides]|uniref:interleukin-6 n=1 Tax=Dromiciops gliroides TaxID=33562 RepID=UPI001CC7D5B2|nr:interleukin-6 [Dromiciops gliroides]
MNFRHQFVSCAEDGLEDRGRLIRKLLEQQQKREQELVIPSGLQHLRDKDGDFVSSSSLPPTNKAELSKSKALVKTVTGSLRPLALTLTLLMATAALPIPESLGDGFPGVDVPSKSPSSNPDLDTNVNFARQLRWTAYDLKEQMCQTQNLCDNSNEALAENNLNLPNITERDGCFPSGFNEEACLIKIVSGLQEFDTYLQYMENEMKDKRFQILKLSTAQLAHTLKLLIKKADIVPTPNPTASKNLLSELQSLKAWSKNVCLHLILLNYTRFIEGTIRAVRFLNNRSLDA